MDEIEKSSVKRAREAFAQMDECDHIDKVAVVHEFLKRSGMRESLAIHGFIVERQKDGDGFCVYCHGSGSYENGSWNLIKCPLGCFDEKPPPGYDGSNRFPGITGKQHAKNVAMDALYPPHPQDQSGFFRRVFSMFRKDATDG